MTRRPAAITQADVARVLRAAQQAGQNWRVEVEGSIIRCVQIEPGAAAEPPSLAAEPDTPFACGLDVVP
jgi:hypothetical protein